MTTIYREEDGDLGGGQGQVVGVVGNGKQARSLAIKLSD
jgi:hypothetical protein